MNSSQIKSIFKQLRKSIVPSEDWKKRNRDLLMRQIGFVEEKNSTNRFAFFVGFLREARDLAVYFPGLFIRPVLSLMLLVGVVLGGGNFTMSAAKSSGPGDKLYFVKRSLEKASLSMAIKKEKKIRLKVAYSQERVKEIQTLRDREDEGGQVNQEVQDLAPVLREIKDDFDMIKNDFKEIQTQRSEEVVQIAQLIEEKSVQIGKDLDSVETEERFWVESALASMEQAGMDALEAMIAKYEEGKLSEEQKLDLVERINERIEQASEETKKILGKLINEILDEVEETRSESLEKKESDKKASGERETIIFSKSDSEKLQGSLESLKGAAKDLEKGNVTRAFEKLNQGYEVLSETEEWFNEDQAVSEEALNSLEGSEEDEFEVQGIIMEETDTD